MAETSNPFAKYERYNERKRARAKTASQRGETLPMSTSEGNGQGRLTLSPAPLLEPTPLLPLPEIGREPWPDWLEGLRPHQADAVEEILAAYENGAKLVWLDGPTGTGKTLIAEIVRRYLAQPTTYICTTKALQDQFCKDYPYAKVLKGRGNYPTERMPWPHYTAAECGYPTIQQCGWCDSRGSCPYEVAKKAALRAPLTVLNTTKFLYDANYTGNFSTETRARQFIILDEVDVAEKELMNFVSFSVSDQMLNRLGLIAPKKGVHKSTIAEWMASDLLPVVESALTDIGMPQDSLQMRRYNVLCNIRDGAKRLVEHVEDENWVRDYSGDMVLKPVRVEEEGRYLWGHGDKYLAMSATLISADELETTLGVPEEWDTEVVRVPMTFPVENRKVYVRPVAKLTKATEDEALPKIANRISEILDEYKHERILVHTVSYKLTEYLRNHLRSDRTITYSESRQKEKALAQYLERDDAVLLAPSFDRGIDLPGDQCRVCIIAKVPYLSLGDRRVSTRLRLSGGQLWYTIQAVRSIVQMTGRGVRAEDDWCVTFILDSTFKKQLWKRYRRLFPEWWREAVTMGR